MVLKVQLNSRGSLVSSCLAAALNTLVHDVREREQKHLKHLCAAVECCVGLSGLPEEDQGENVDMQYLLYLEERPVRETDLMTVVDIRTKVLALLLLRTSTHFSIWFPLLIKLVKRYRGFSHNLFGHTTVCSEILSYHLC